MRTLLLLIPAFISNLAAGWEPGTFKKPAQADLQKSLTEQQFSVTQRNDTEPAFKNAFWDSHSEGIFVDVVSGEPLFSTTDKFDPGTGWPSFTKPLVANNLVYKPDNSFYSPRVEVRSRYGDSHLGHVFEDGPQPTRKRYSINSASLRFVPKDKLNEQGYGEFTKLFQKKASK